MATVRVTMPARSPWKARASSGMVRSPRPARGAGAQGCPSPPSPEPAASAGIIRLRQRLRVAGGVQAARPAPAQREAVDEPGHGSVGADPLGADPADGLGGDAAGRLPDDLGQVDLVDDVVGQPDEVHPFADQRGEVHLVEGRGHHPGQVDPLGDEGGQVHLVERGGHQPRQVDAFDHQGGQVHLVERRLHDGVDVEPRHHDGRQLIHRQALHHLGGDRHRVDLGQHLRDHRLEVELGDHDGRQRIEVESAHQEVGGRRDVHRVEHMGDQPVDVEPVDPGGDRLVEVDALQQHADEHVEVDRARHPVDHGGDGVLRDAGRLAGQLRAIGAPPARERVECGPWVQGGGDQRGMEQGLGDRRRHPYADLGRAAGGPRAAPGDAEHGVGHLAGRVTRGRTAVARVAQRAQQHLGHEGRHPEARPHTGLDGGTRGHSG